MALTLDIEQIETQWRPIPTEIVDQVEDLIDRSIAMIRVRFRTIDARVDSDPDLMKVAQGVVIDMIKRAIPSLSDGDDGGRVVTQEMLVAGSFTHQKIYDKGSANVYLLDSELLLLRPPRRRGKSIHTRPLSWT